MEKHNWTIRRIPSVGAPSELFDLGLTEEEARERIDILNKESGIGEHYVVCEER